MHEQDVAKPVTAAEPTDVDAKILRSSLRNSVLCGIPKPAIRMAKGSPTSQLEMAALLVSSDDVAMA